MITIPLIKQNAAHVDQLSSCYRNDHLLSNWFLWNTTKTWQPFTGPRVNPRLFGGGKVLHVPIRKLLGAVRLVVEHQGIRIQMESAHQSNHSEIIRVSCHSCRQPAENFSSQRLLSSAPWIVTTRLATDFPTDPICCCTQGCWEQTWMVLTRGLMNHCCLHIIEHHELFQNMINHN